MRRKLIVLIAIVLCATSVRAEFKVGVSTRDITPTESLPMWGYGLPNRPENMSTGVHDPLSARAIVIHAGGEKMAIVGLDLGRAPDERMVTRLRENLKQKAGIEHVLFGGSHTHHGPAVEMEAAPGEAIHRYYQQLERALDEVVLEASQGAVDAKMGWASADSDWNRNRREDAVIKVRDPELLVIRFDTLDDAPIATLVNFAGHPTVHPPQWNKYSAEWPGVMKREVDKAMGTTTVFIQGAAGDLQCEMDDSLWGEKDFIEEVGSGIASEVIPLARTIRTAVPEDTSIQGTYKEFDVPLRIDLTVDANVERLRAAYGGRMFDAYHAKYVGNRMHPRLTTILLNDALAFVGVSGEFFSEHSLYLKHHLEDLPLVFAGYCNGHDLYFPTIKGAAEGGYGASPAVAWVEVGAPERMINEALISLFDMRGLLGTL